MTSKNPDVIAAGHLCLDIFPLFTNKPGQKISDLLRPGTLVKTGAMSFATGGSVSNTGIALKMFGCNVAFVAKVGDDVIGSIIINILKKQGNADGITIAKGEVSSYSVVLAPVGIDRIFLHCPGTNDTFVSGDIDFSLVEKARLFHFGYPSLMDATHANDGKELAMIFTEAKRRGATTSMDISLPDPNSPAGRANWRAVYEKTLPFVDIYLPSIEESFFTLYPAEYLQRKALHGGEELVDHITPDEFSKVATEFIDMGCAMVALKAGHNGWYFKTAPTKRFTTLGRLVPKKIDEWTDIEIWCPAFKIEAIASATGSGDTSIAAFLASLLKEKSPHGCLKMANCAGYMNLRSMDALSGLCSWDDMEKIIPELTVREIPTLQNSEWKWNGEKKIWEH